MPDEASAKDQRISQALDLMRQKEADRKRALQEEKAKAINPVSLKDIQSTNPGTGQAPARRTASSTSSAAPSGPIRSAKPLTSSSSDSRPASSGGGSAGNGLSDSREDMLSSAGGDDGGMDDMPMFPGDQELEEAGAESPTQTQQAQALREKERGMMRSRDQFIGKDEAGGNESGGMVGAGASSSDPVARDRARAMEFQQQMVQARIEQANANQAQQAASEEDGQETDPSTILRDFTDVFNAVTGVVTIIGFIWAVISLNGRLIFGKKGGGSGASVFFPPMSRPAKMATILFDFCCCVFAFAVIGIAAAIIIFINMSLSEKAAVILK